MTVRQNPGKPSARGVRRGPGELESEVLALLWVARGAKTAAWVQSELAGNLAYTTVVTILSRLHDKGLLARARVGRAYAYTPVTDEAGVVARRMRELLDHEADRQAVLASFVSELSAADESTLRALLSSDAPAESRG
ncbi:BlaI/MecI/CopY family transcriptional regulator [Embleya sp. AB8]|uniref:BlaI/MecI/CopY family transcriptional regulator n=1 Tax=Embleya sp. AB8 TaxID=3156304 RepID=UPI003C73FD6F